MYHQKKTHLSLILIFFVLSQSGNMVQGQSNLPEIYETGTLNEQLDYMHEKTRIYNGFRAIREDMFQKIRTNSSDSLASAKKDILLLQRQLSELGDSIEMLQTNLQNLNVKLDQAINNRDRLKFLGIPVHKSLYNSIMWIVIASLAFLLGITFISAKRNFSISRHLKNDLEEVREQFEVHRKQSRERHEQLVVKHHNEMRKLKGK